ncbi:hypothetical protein QOZ80_2AG0146360 [Eleusine coracana subsp. coracana]|nr:hypothetical protein QOZ80_2AG0146360 [Eleusine coracana subsp. coracana]
MASSSVASTLLLAFAVLFHTCLASRHLTALVQEPAITMKYHKGALLSGPIAVNFIWYGNFSAPQRAVITDFVSSLSPSSSGSQPEPSVATWFNTARKYYATSKARFPSLHTGAHVLDQSYSLGKRLGERDLLKLAARGGPSRSINVVLTAHDVAVDGFCMSRCGTHGASRRSSSSGGRFAYVWVGNPATQCAGQCAWPFHQPAYGPQSPPLTAPNGDVGVDGMVISLASMIVGTVTNPFGNGFFQEGSADAPLEVATACAGVYGKGAYPGYTGSLLVDQATGASYNANGAHGRKYLVPALVDPDTSSCATLG